MEITPLTKDDCLQRIKMARDYKVKLYWYNRLQDILDFERKIRLQVDLIKRVNDVKKAMKSPSPDWYYITQTQEYIRAIKQLLKT